MRKKYFFVSSSFVDATTMDERKRREEKSSAIMTLITDLTSHCIERKNFFLPYLKIGCPRSSLYHKMSVTRSLLFGTLISQGKLTLVLAKATMRVTLASVELEGVGDVGGRLLELDGPAKGNGKCIYLIAAF